MARLPRFSWHRALLAFSVFALLALSGYALLFRWDAGGDREPRWGVTFSHPHAVWLGLDWQEAYLALLDDLGVRRFRLSAYWNWMEEADDRWRFDDLDWLLDRAAERGATVILAVGRRLPRWPECHVPAWASELPEARQQEELLEHVRTIVDRYRNHPAVAVWQVENEPLLMLFGECPPPDAALLRREIALVRALDSSHPILITDSGELSFWMRTAPLGDLLGTTMYRVVWNTFQGYWRYDRILPASLYRVKAFLAGKPPAQMLIAELQAEPWVPLGVLADLPLAEQRRSMNVEQFRRNIATARRSGFAEASFWGSEYWYWLKATQGDASLWEEARALFADH